MKTVKNISVIGLGKLGLPFAAFYAQKYHVYGFDKSPTQCKLLDFKNARTLTEPHVLRLLKKHKKNIHAAHSLEEALHNSNVTFIIVPTPSQKDGSFSISYVVSAIQEIASILKTKKENHLITLVSTVLPTAIDTTIIPELKKTLGSKAFLRVNFCYSPEFIALGSVIHNLSHPEFILIGENDRASGLLLANLKLSLCPKSTPVCRMNFVNAELAKIASNSFITMKISFANMVARMSERLPGGDSDTITSTIGIDKRIGTSYFKGAVAYGGPCYPRDNFALASVAKKLGVSAELPLTTHAFNKKQNSFLLAEVLKYVKKTDVIGIVGLSYKPDTEVIDEAPGFLLAQQLVKRRKQVIVSHFLSNLTEVVLEDRRVPICSTQELIKKADMVVFTMPYKEIYEIPLRIFRLKKSVTVIDCWRLRPDLQKLPQLKYIALGVFPEK